MKKKKTKNIIISIVVLVLVISAAFIINAATATSPTFTVTEEEKDKAYNLLKRALNNKDLVSTPREDTYADFMMEHEVTYDLNDAVAINDSQSSFIVRDDYRYASYNPSYTHDLIKIEYGDKITYTVNVTTSGLYSIQFDYQLLNDNVLNNSTIGIKINGQYQYSESAMIDVPLMWDGYEGEFPQDSYGDETIPVNEKTKDTWFTTFAYDNNYITVLPLNFYFASGNNTIEIEYVSGNSVLLLGEVVAKSPKQIPSYNDYSSKYQGTPIYSDIKSHNAVYYKNKNSSYLSLGTALTPSVSPYSSSKSYVNIINGTTWKNSGQMVTYEIEVEHDGLYKLAFHYQNEKPQFYSFRSIYIDGEIPCQELLNYPFKDTSNSWANETLNIDDEDMMFYLSQGKHTISFCAEMENIYEASNIMRLVIDHINFFSLQILIFTTGDIDTDRSWKLTESIPETVSYLEAYRTLMQYVVMQTAQFSEEKESASTISYIQKALVTLKKLMKKPNDLPLYMNNLSRGSSSISQMLGDSLTNFQTQPLALDYLYVYNNKPLPKANADFIEKTSSSIARTWSAYFDDKYKNVVDDEYVNVWVSRPLTYINIMQSMIDVGYNANTTGRKVKLSMMPDQTKLILSNAAGENPDVALGLASYMPFDLAIRNAAYDLSSFSDFYEVASLFAPGTLVPFVLNDKFYGIPESLDFNVLIYRRDLMDNFDIDIPSTWDDLIGITSKLNINGMNFYMPISADNSTKWFYQTSPLIYQYGGTLYNEDGLTTSIGSEEAVKGLTLLTELFKNYSIDASVPSFYTSFRYGKTPLGIASFSTYLQIKNAAPELIGKWAIDAPLGVTKADGSVDRSYISNGTSAIIFKNTNYPQDSWNFLKWWTSTSVQIDFANRLQSTYGPEYMWLSSNLEAISEASFDSKDKQVILDSLEYILDIPRTPGQYMLERGLSNIWTDVVLNNKAIGVCIDQQILLINREINRKMIEFGYIDNNGNKLKLFIVREKQWVIDTIKAHKGN